jgi:serine/threonine protein phosphatase 1
MALTYVIPDLHGRRDLLDAALARIDTHAGGNAGTIVVLGDYVDKGPDSRGCGRE